MLPVILSCSGKKGFLDGAEYRASLNAATEVYIMPTDFAAFVLSPQTKSLVPDEDVSRAASGKIISRVKEMVAGKGYKVVQGIPETMDTEHSITMLKDALIAYRDANQKLLSLKARKKYSEIKMTIPLPEEFYTLTSNAPVSLFVSGQARVMGKGEYGKKVLKETGKSVLITAATLGFIWSVPNVGTEARASFSAALVDNRTGAILWHNADTYSSDLKREGAAEECMDKLLKNIKSKGGW